jgi:hypothetical protein
MRPPFSPASEYPEPVVPSFVVEGNELCLD